MDHETEAFIHQMIEQQAGSRTFIIIAHRLSSITSADHVILLEQGLVADEGKHEELVLRNKIYNSILLASN